MAKLHPLGHGHVAFHCPGCGNAHTVRVEGAMAWGWNGSVDSPTFQPSVKLGNGHHKEGFRRGVDRCWCTYNSEHPEDPATFSCILCHSYVTDGRIQFLGDSTHALAGQTVELPEWQDADPPEAA